MQQSTDVVRRTNWVDPICGMQVDSSTAAAEDVYIGVRYLFCSEECRRLFVRSAPRWITGNWPTVATASGMSARSNAAMRNPTSRCEQSFCASAKAAVRCAGALSCSLLLVNWLAMPGPAQPVVINGVAVPPLPPLDPAAAAEGASPASGQYCAVVTGT